MDELFNLKLCSDGAAFEVKSKRRVKLDLPSIGDELAVLTNMKIRVSLPVILILEGNEGQSITLYPSGRLLLRKFHSEESARQLVMTISSRLYGNS
jgi:ArsR family metal-binding transcriptional regulator